MCKSCRRDVCDGACFLEKVLQPAFALAPDSTLRPQLVTGATVQTTPRFAVTLPLHPDARWSDGFPSRRGTSSSPTPRSSGISPATFRARIASFGPVRPVDAKTVRVVLRSRTAEWQALFPASCRRTLSGGRTSKGCGATGSRIPGRARRSGAARSFSRAGIAGKQMILVRNPRYWGSHTAYLDRIVIRFCQSCPLLPTPSQALAGLRQRDFDMTFTRDPSIIPEFLSIPG